MISEEIRVTLEQIAKIEKLETRASELDSCLSWIDGEMGGGDLSDQELTRVNNIRKAHCREFLKHISTYGNSGYAEAAPLGNLFMNHIKIFSELDQEDPELVMKCRQFFQCLD